MWISWFVALKKRKLEFFPLSGLSCKSLSRYLLHLSLPPSLSLSLSPFSLTTSSSIPLNDTLMFNLSLPHPNRYHFYKQLKRDLLHGKLKVGTSVKAARLTALIAQIDKGDYRVGFQYQHKVMCQATESDNMDARIRREHQFLEEVSMLELYGVELYHVLNNHRVPQVIGVGPENVQVYSRSMELQKRCVFEGLI